MKKQRVDICVIGAGSGGLSVAAGAAQLGVSVALIESGKMGGDCLNYGCVPSKALIAAAKRASVFRTSGPFGIKAQEPTIDFKKLNKHIHEVIASIAPHDSVERFESLGVKVFKGNASFLSPTIVQVGNTQISAKFFVIATGSSPAVPPIPGIDKTPFLTNETVFDLKEKPKHLIVIGGGPIGCEIAQAYSLLGAKVSIVEAFTILPREDQEVVDVIRKKFLQAGITLYENAKVQSLDGLKVHLEHQDKEVTLTGSHVLLSTGRKPNLNQLNLDKAGVKYTSHGIQVDERLRTSQKKIYAIGDVAGSYQFTHMAAYHAQIIIKNCLFRLPATVNYRVVPWVTYTSPEVAHVGIAHQDAPPKSKTLVWPYHESDRAQAERETEGFIKVTASKKGYILGVSIVGENAGELITPWILAMKQKLKLNDLAEMIVPYPTLSEITKRVSGSFYTPLLFSPFTRGLVRFLMKVIP